MNFLKLSLLSILVVFFSFLNFLNISFLGVKPNFALAAIIAVLFFAGDIFEGLFLIALSSLILKFSPIAGKDILVYFFVCVAMLLIKKYLPWQNFLGSIVLVSFSTLLFYAFLFSNSIASPVFFKEIAYNIIASSFVFLVLSRFKIFNAPSGKIFNINR